MLDSDNEFDDFVETASVTSTSSDIIEFRIEVDECIENAMKEVENDNFEKTLEFLLKAKETLFFRAKALFKEITPKFIQFLELDNQEVIFFVLNMLEDSVEISEQTLEIIFETFLPKLVFDGDEVSDILKKMFIIIVNIYPQWIKHISLSKTNKYEELWNKTKEFNLRMISTLTNPKSSIEQQLISLKVLEKASLCFLPTDMKKEISLSGRPNNIVEGYGPNTFTSKLIKKKHSFLTKSNFESLGKNILSTIAATFDDSLRQLNILLSGFSLKCLCHIFLYRPKSRQPILDGLTASLRRIINMKESKLGSFLLSIKQSMRICFLPFLKLESLKYYHTRIAKLVQSLIKDDEYTNKAIQGLGKSYKTEQEFDVVLKAAPTGNDIADRRLDELHKQASELKKDTISEYKISIFLKLLSYLPERERLRFNYRVTYQEDIVFKVIIKLLDIETTSILLNLIFKQPSKIYNNLDFTHILLCFLFINTNKLKLPLKRKNITEEKTEYLILLEQVIKFHKEPKRLNLINKFFFDFLDKLPSIPNYILIFCNEFIIDNIIINNNINFNSDLLQVILLFLTKLCLQNLYLQKKILNLLFYYSIHNNKKLREITIKLLINIIYLNNNINISKKIENFSIKYFKICFNEKFENYFIFKKEIEKEFKFNNENNMEINEDNMEIDKENQEEEKLEFSITTVDRFCYLQIVLCGVKPSLLEQVSEFVNTLEDNKKQIFYEYKVFKQVIQKVFHELSLSVFFELISDLYIQKGQTEFVTQCVIIISSPQVIGKYESSLEFEKHILELMSNTVSLNDKFIFNFCLLPFCQKETIISILKASITSKEFENIENITENMLKAIFIRIFLPLPLLFGKEIERLTSTELLSHFLSDNLIPTKFCEYLFKAFMNTKYQTGLSIFTKDNLTLILTEKFAIKSDKISPLLFATCIGSLKAYPVLKSLIANQIKLCVKEEKFNKILCLDDEKQSILKDFSQCCFLIKTPIYSTLLTLDVDLLIKVLSFEEELEKGLKYYCKRMKKTQKKDLKEDILKWIEKVDEKKEV